MGVSIGCHDESVLCWHNAEKNVDHWMMHCGLEVILPTGELVRTGMGALPDGSTASKDNQSLRPDQQTGNKCWQLFNYGFGPYNDGIFTQSSLGIVVKMGIWVMDSFHILRRMFTD